MSRRPDDRAWEGVGPMANHKSNGCAFTWSRGCVAPLIVASPALLGSAAFAQESTAPANASHITEQQQAVMRRLEELYQRDGREMPSLRLEDAPNTYIPPDLTVRPVEEAVAEQPNSMSQTVSPVGAVEEPRRGVFSWFRGRGSNAGTGRPSLFGRMRGRGAEAAPAASPEPRQSLMGRLMSPFRDEGGKESAGDEGAGEARDYAAEGSESFVPPPAPSAPAAPPAARTARLEDEIRYRDSGLLLKRVNPGADEVDPPALVPLPDDDVFETLPPAREEQSVPNPSMFEDIEAAPAAKSGPPMAPAANVPAPDATFVDPRTFEPIGEDVSLNTIPDTGVSQRPIAEITASPGDPTEDARYVALSRKLAERQGLVGMQGFCPVALREQRELVNAQPEFLCVHRGRTYQVSSAGAKARFDANPELYAPAARGLDVVLMSRGVGSIDGTLTNSIWYRDRLYLFSTPETAREFNVDPARYIAGE